MKIEFDVNQSAPKGMNRYAQSAPSALVALLIKIGWAKDEKTANNVSMIIIIVSLVLITATFAIHTQTEKVDDKYYYDPSVSNRND
ncbi:MAG: hypothetical protein ACI9H6_000086 [Patiriisocius sp.]|jgi:hypothetical protein